MILFCGSLWDRINGIYLNKNKENLENLENKENNKHNK